MLGPDRMHLEAEKSEANEIREKRRGGLFIWAGAWYGRYLRC